MRPPSILSGEDVRTEDREPPPQERQAAHKWLKEDALGRYSELRGVGFELYLSKLAEEKIRNHAIRNADTRREVMGLMLGGIYTFNGRRYAMVRDVATTDLEASSVHVRFHRESFEKLFDSLDGTGFDYVIVGWYHSHPGHKCFMSSTDIVTQQTLFDLPLHNALVIDPISREIEVYYLDQGTIRTRDFTVYWDEYENPYHGTTVRRRMLRSDPNSMAPAH